MHVLHFEKVQPLGTGLSEVRDAKIFIVLGVVLSSAAGIGWMFGRGVLFLNLNPKLLGP